MKAKSAFYFFIPLSLLIYVYIHFVAISLSPDLPKPGHAPILYSNQYKGNLRMTLLKAINKAKKDIHLVMFGLTEPSILRSLANKAKYQHVQTNIYYDPKASYELSNQMQRVDVHPIYESALMHQKILVVDERMVFMGSANMTSPSLEMHDNIILGLYSPKLASFLSEKTPHGKGHMRTMVGGQDIDVWLLPDPRGKALTKLKSLIRKAHDRVQVAMFTLTHPLLIDELIAARKRGVYVSVVIDYTSAIGSSSKAVHELKREGIEVVLKRSTEMMHHKFLYIDNKTLVLGSTNWTKAAFYKNHDCFVILNQVTKEQKDFMQKIWRTLDS